MKAAVKDTRVTCLPTAVSIIIEAAEIYEAAVCLISRPVPTSILTINQRNRMIILRLHLPE